MLGSYALPILCPCALPKSHRPWANKKEIAEAIAVAMFISAGSQLGWTNDLGKNVYDLIFEDKRSEEMIAGRDVAARNKASVEKEVAELSIQA